MEAALPAGVLDAAGIGEAMPGLVQQGAQNSDRTFFEALAADEQLGQPVVGVLPATSGEMA
jgi:hypothetical protein